MAKANRAKSRDTTLPDLPLTWPDGRAIRLSDYRHDHNLVACFSGGAECAPCRHAVLSDICSQPDDYAQVGAVVLLVLRCSSIEAELVRRRENLNLPILLDPTGEACRLLGAQSPDGNAGIATIVTDCVGRIYLASRPDQNTLPPTREAIFKCLRGIPATNCLQQSPPVNQP